MIGMGRQLSRLDSEVIYERKIRIKNGISSKKVGSTFKNDVVEIAD
jgi:hypothetical protein